MANLFKWYWPRLVRPHSPPRRFAGACSPILCASQKIDEETLPGYLADNYYPVYIGDIYNSRYQILGKIGYGTHSTVWISRDLMAHRYAALKIFTRMSSPTTQENRELEIYRHLSTIKSSHPGRHFVRTMLDTFQLSWAGGYHDCIVHKPMFLSLQQLQMLGNNRKTHKDLLRGAVRYLLKALDYLHTECQIIHTDIQATNVLVDLEDDSILEDFEKEAVTHASPGKLVGDRIIYPSRKLPLTKKFGNPILCDFGEARLGSLEHDDDIQPTLYRAPEVVLEMKWGYSVDIWSVGCMIWDLYEGKHLFDTIDPVEKEYSAAVHLAEMVALLGSPPPDFLQRSEISPWFFNKQGKFDEDLDVNVAPTRSLENMEENLEGFEKQQFLAFIRSMLKWVPEERLTARQLLRDPWLNAPPEII